MRIQDLLPCCGFDQAFVCDRCLQAQWYKAWLLNESLLLLHSKSNWSPTLLCCCSYFIPLSLQLHLFSWVEMKLGRIFLLLLLFFEPSKLYTANIFELAAFWLDVDAHSAPLTAHLAETKPTPLPHCITSDIMCLFSCPARDASAFCFSSRYISLRRVRGLSADCLS